MDNIKKEKIKERLKRLHDHLETKGEYDSCAEIMSIIASMDDDTGGDSNPNFPPPPPPGPGGH